jgi:hypothetical protein
MSSNRVEIEVSGAGASREKILMVLSYSINSYLLG